MTEKSASEKTAKSKGDAGRDARAKDSPAASAVKSETTGSGSHSSPKKRRKVNHGIRHPPIPLLRFSVGVIGWGEGGPEEEEVPGLTR
ncbi:unnamed protein product [Penicillium pancosmium]